MRDISDDPDFNGLLDMLENFVLLENWGISLTEVEKERYVQIVDILHKYEVPIPFGIEI
jgi:hypothetical protein